MPSDLLLAMAANALDLFLLKCLEQGLNQQVGRLHAQTAVMEEMVALRALHAMKWIQAEIAF